MYSIVILCAVLSVVSARDTIQLSPQFLSKVEPLIKKCEAETSSPENAFKNMLSGIVENEASLKFSYCYLLEAGFMFKDGKINAEKLISLMKDADAKETFKNFIEDCNNRANTPEPIEVLRQILSCYKNDSPFYFAA